MDALSRRHRCATLAMDESASRRGGIHNSFVKRQKNDAAGAEAIVEAAQWPTMRTVAVKSADQQARAMLFRTRELLIGQRTQLANALRRHLHRHLVPQGVGNVIRFAAIIAEQVSLVGNGWRL